MAFPWTFYTTGLHSALDASGTALPSRCLRADPARKISKRKLSYDYNGAIPIGAIDEAEQENTIEGVLFAKWAIERNARCAARLLREVGLRSQARALRYQPTSARAAA
jgi:hypothetical protein